MSEDFEARLREALRPVDPGEHFAQRVLLRVNNERPVSPRIRMPGRLWLPTVLAASVVLAMLIAYQWHAERERTGLEARRQLMQALQLTGRKLDLAYEVIKRQPAANTDNHSGA